MGIDSQQRRMGQTAPSKFYGYRLPTKKKAGLDSLLSVFIKKEQEYSQADEPRNCTPILRY